MNKYNIDILDIDRAIEWHPSWRMGRTPPPSPFEDWKYRRKVDQQGQRFDNTPFQCLSYDKFWRGIFVE